MLPPDFRWHSVGTASFDRPNFLPLDNMEVLWLYERMDDGTWWASLNHHRGHLSDRKAGLCSAYEQRREGPELWAERHHDRLRANVDRMRLGRATGRREPRGTGGIPSG